jgi:hypothetical protein
MSDYSGRWFTTFGPMDLTQKGNQVRGSYFSMGAHCPIEGVIEDGRLKFTYQEPEVKGEGWFEQIRHGKFAGKWRPIGGEAWQAWQGHREFDGVWDSSFGLLRLVQEPDRVLGFYEGAGPANLEGKLQGGRLTFRYQEPRAAGEGAFDLAPDGQSFSGQWRPEGSPKWAPWVGRRVLPARGIMWLVIIEAHWQRSLLDRDYSFGRMLREFFARLGHVNVRHRFFDDEVGLERWCRELMYIPEPTAVVLAAHATEEGLAAHGKPLPASLFAPYLRYADNVAALHFSSCLVMKDGKTADLIRSLQDQVCFPISGYDRSVDWAASALIEFHYLDMILGRGLTPAEAADQLGRLLAYAGDHAAPNSAYPPAGFRIALPRRG